MKRGTLVFFCFLLGLNGGVVYAGEAPLKVVATTTTFADLVKKVGRERVSVAAVAPARWNVHFVEPKPSDVRNAAGADLFVHAGLDLELWVDPLLEAAGKTELFRGGPRNVDLSRGIELLKVPTMPVSRAQGDIHLYGNPHYVMNPENAGIMAKTIEGKLAEADPAHAESYARNLKEFLEELDKRVGHWKRLCGHCRDREVISYHDDVEYFVRFLGMRAEQFVEPKPGIPPTPRHLEFLQGYMKEKAVKVIVMPTYYPREAAAALAARAGGKVLTLCQNAGEIRGTEDFFSFFEYNFHQISEALK
ncbi:MAG: zinc ABC transporter substrate-binding protein [Candidatus Omnitrophica bacterium]|nr:zinc ABC transporter substrate-binding protein [Candidatus Omnitrophota bacterium]